MPRHRLISAAGLLAAVALAVAGCRSQKPPPPMPTPKVSAVKPANAAVTDFWEYNGYLAPSDTVDVRARVKGFLNEKYFKEGAEVTGKVAWFSMVLYKGDLLYQIDKREYLTAQSKAKADLAKAEAEVVKAAADIQNWEAQISLAKVELARAEESLAKRVGSKTDVDRAQATLEVNAAQRDAAKAELRASESARESAASALHSTEIQLGYTDVHAPISGQIGRTAVDVGNLVGQSDPTLLTTIIRVDRLYAYFDVPERDLLQYMRDAGRLKLPHPPNDTIPVEVRVPGPNSEWHRGRIDYVEASVTPGTGTVRARGVIPNDRREPSSTLRVFVPGLYVQVRVPKGPPDTRLVLPEDAIMTGQEGRFVFVVGANNVVEKRLVTLGPVVWKSPPPSRGQVLPSWRLENPNPGPPPEKGPPPPTRRPVNSVVAILDGLKPDDRVIVDGVQRSRPGAPVAPEDWVMYP
ncbi:MAG TPA: efflux RND transporter periplasmic adaptor subunit, partial [Gemmata sp.]|nr:efflux RND transporter periplasmic adaptor subunit [Gemmata sp.]